MKYIKILLVMVVLIELAFVVRKSLDMVPPPLPLSNLDGLEDRVAEEIRAAESKHNPAIAQSWIVLADMYRSFGLLPEAAYSYEQVDKVKSDETAHLYYWALCESRMGNLEKSHKLFQRAIDAEPNRLQAQYAMLRMGQDHLRQNNPTAAKEYLRKAVQIGAAKIWLCRLLIREGNVPEAIALMEICVNQFPRSIRAHQILAWAYEKQGDARKARGQYELAARSFGEIPSDEPVRKEDEQILGQFGSPALQLQSYILEQQGKLDEALESVKQALAITWKEDYALQQSFLLMKNKQPEEAAKVLEECIKRTGKSAENLVLLGDAYRQAKKTPQAIQVWEQAVLIPASRRPQDAISVREKLVQAYREVGGDAKVVRKHEGFFHFARGKINFLNNELNQAQEELARAVKLIPQEPIAWYYLAETLRHNKRYAESADAYQTCLKLNPNHGRALRGLQFLKEDRK